MSISRTTRQFQRKWARERNSNTSTKANQNTKLITAAWRISVGKIWSHLLILFHFCMINLALNISLWKFTLIIFYPTTSHLHNYSFLLVFLPAQNLLLKSWINVWLIFLHPPLSKRLINSVGSSIELSCLSLSLSLSVFLTGWNYLFIYQFFINLISSGLLFLFLLCLKLFQLMILLPWSSSA